MTARPTLVLAALLLVVRLPSLVQPMGADQGLYAYIADRILAGELPYRDAWDQKPPAIHYTYAALRAVWPGHAVVALADLLAAAVVAALLYRLGGTLGGLQAGAASALLFLLLTNPAFTRLGGVRLRAQCETFMAVTVTAALVLIARAVQRHETWRFAAAGALLGLTFVLKYNAGVYVLTALGALWAWRCLTPRAMIAIAAGFVVPVALMLIVFAIGDALPALYDATIIYNLRYSGETYGGAAQFLGYLFSFPVQQARIDATWTLGGAGCLVLLAAASGGRERLVPVIWVAIACLSIAINGSRGLPQYFVQANPALALAAGVGGTLAWSAMQRRPGFAARVAGAAAVVVLAVAVWRVNQFPKLVEQTWFDTAYALGRMAPTEHLARYADERKYSALGAAELSEYLRTHSEPDETVYVFGFTSSAYVDAARRSASRFFWSRPVIVGFNDGEPGYGAPGLLGDLSLAAPAVVALQQRDWHPDVEDSADFFMATPPLADWLRTHYERTEGPEGFDTWMRRTARP